MEENKIKRRTVLKALAGLPVFGLFAINFDQKKSLIQKKKDALIDELGINKLESPIKKSRNASKSDLIRIGMVGFGHRAVALAHGLGYMLPETIAKMKKNGTYGNWLAQEDLNVAVTGICDVFDEHAERGLKTVSSKIGGGKLSLPVKRYKHYHEMLDSNEIDAVVIATPEHHHAQMTIDAIQAGKHVYCEKSFTRTEEEVYQVYDVVKNSNLIFQLGHQIPQSTAFQKAKQIINKNILGDIRLIETTTNRNTPHGAWIRHLNKDGSPKPGNPQTIDWKQWLGSRPYVPFSIKRYYDWTLCFDYSTGMLGQLFTHEFDAINQLLNIGIPSSAMSSGGIYTYKDGRDIPDNLQVAFEYPKSDLTLLYSATLASSFNRGRVIMGRDARMKLGNTIEVTADSQSKRYKKYISEKLIDTEKPMFVFNQGVDAVSSATSKYYTSRGLVDTVVNGKKVDLTHLHLKEWLDVIRYGGMTSANIERAFEEGITIQMAQKSYVEKRRVEWDPKLRKIV